MSSDRSSAASTSCDQARFAKAPPLSSDEEAGLWHRADLGDVAAKQALVLHYQNLARQLAASAYAKRFERSLEFDDFYQYALIGLMEAIERYQSDKGATFSTFATYRIKGAILNGVEKLTEQQQQTQARKRILAERAAALKNDSGKTGNLDDLFAELANIAIGLAIGCILEESGLYRSNAEEALPDTAYKRYELKQLRAHVVSLVETLEERLRLIIKLHYFHGVKFEDIAREMGLSKGRVSQLHRAALTKLSKQYETTSGIDKQF